jgi:hypothetical protein
MVIDMTRAALARLIGSEFDEFLSASIGEDRNGTGLSALSALARLDVDHGSESSRMGRFRVWLDQGSPLSLTGRAELSDDRAKIKQLWSSLHSAFWSDERDLSIRVLKITPTIAEYWDRAGAIASTAEMVKAALTGSQPDLRTNERVALS